MATYRVRLAVLALLPVGALVAVGSPPATASAAGHVRLSVRATTVTGTAAVVRMAERPAVRGRAVAVWGHLRGSAGWTRLARGREPSTGRLALPTTFPRSGTWTVRVRLYAASGHRRRDLADRSVRARPGVVPTLIAHSGGAGEAPESTMAAFGHAVDEGTPALETDVQETADGALVLVHDVTLARTTDVATRFPGRADDRVGTFTLEEIRRLSVSTPAGGPQPVATFDELLAFLGAHDGVTLLAEAKHPETSPDLARLMLDAVRRAGLADGRVAFESYDLPTLRTFRELAPSSVVSPILDQAPADPSTLAWADTLTVRSASLTRSWVTRAHASGLEVNAFTPDTERELLALADDGVDGLITDVPGRALDALS